MNDSWGRFWERLVTEWVAIGVFGFVVQGLWFGLVSVLVESRPGMESGLLDVSAKLGVPWAVGILLGLAWSVKRAMDARNEPLGRR